MDRVQSSLRTHWRLWLIVYVVVMLILAVVAGLAIRQWWQPAPEPPSEEAAAVEAAPDATSTPPAAAGGTLVQAVSSGPLTFNPLLAVDPAAEAVIDQIYPRLVGQDPHQGFITPSGLAQRWEISPDGLVYTFSLRPGVLWSDGQPVHAGDFVFTYGALADPSINSPYRDRTAAIARVDAPDPATVVVTLTAPHCAILHSLRRPLLPSHLFAPDYHDVVDHPLHRAPTVSAGPFRFVVQEGDRVTLARNPDFYQGAPRIEQWVVQTIAAPEARVAALATGAVDLAYFAPEELAQLPPTLPGMVMHPVPTDGYHLVALNLADPMQPVAGVTAEGAGQAQPPHPILGNLTVRQALAAAVDSAALIDGLFGGQANRLGSYVPAMTGWAAAPIPPPAYDPSRAAQLLDAAGWTLATGETLRRRDGMVLQLSLVTNADNPLRVALAQQLALQWAQVGVGVEVRPVAFEELAAELLEQRFDLALIGWEGLGADPGTSPFWHSRDDAPSAGFNVSSVHDAEIDAWLDAAARLPGCDINTRAELYRQVQQRVALLQPVIFLAQPWAMWATGARVQGVTPAPWRFTHNLTQWQLLD